MALAINPVNVGVETTAETRAAGWTSVSALIALAATIPLIMMLASPVSRIMFVRGTAADGDWLAVMTAIMILLAPATYLLFGALTADILKTRVPGRVRKFTLKVAAAAALPYVLISGVGFATDSLTLKTIGMLSLLMAIGATIWASTKKH